MDETRAMRQVVGGVEQRCANPSACPEQQSLLNPVEKGCCVRSWAGSRPTPDIDLGRTGPDRQTGLRALRAPSYKLAAASLMKGGGEIGLWKGGQQQAVGG